MIVIRPLHYTSNSMGPRAYINELDLLLIKQHSKGSEANCFAVSLTEGMWVGGGGFWEEKSQNSV